MTLIDQLFTEGYAFDFFQAVRVLERAYPKRRRVGRAVAPRDEVARFRAHLSLNFPPSSIYELEKPKAADLPPLMTVTFLGLTGPEDLAIGDHDVAECHQWIKAGVDQLVSGQRWRVHLDARSYVLDLSDRQWRPITPVSAPRAFRDRVIREILPVFGRRFRLCGRQKCPHPFIARKRKIYCDSRCSQTERTRRYRATHPDKSHEVYARQQRKKFGPNVVVRRRLSRSDRTSPGPKLL